MDFRKLLWPTTIRLINIVGAPSHPPSPHWAPCMKIFSHLLQNFGHWVITTLNMILYCHEICHVTMVTFWMTLIMNKWMNIVIDDGWVHPLARTLPSLVSNLWWKYCHGWSRFGWKNRFVSDNDCNSVNPKKVQGMTNNVGLTISVGDTIPRCTSSI